MPRRFPERARARKLAKPVHRPRRGPRRRLAHRVPREPRQEGRAGEGRGRRSWSSRRPTSPSSSCASSRAPSRSPARFRRSRSRRCGSKVPGEVRRVLVREGEKVARGQLLAEIDTSDLQARLDAQVAALEEAKAKLSIADKNRDNALQLLKQGFISQNAFDTTQSTFEARRGAARSPPRRRSASRATRRRTRSCARPSPASSRRRWSTPGEKVGVDGALFTIVDLAKMEIEAPAPAAEIPGDPRGPGRPRFRVDGFGERVFAGRVERINPTTEQGSRSITRVPVGRERATARCAAACSPRAASSSTRASPRRPFPRRAVREEAGPVLRLHDREGQDRAARGEARPARGAGRPRRRCAAASRRASRS